MKILIVKLSSLGDIFHALPAVHALKSGLDAEVHWVTHDPYVDLVRCFTDVARVIPWPRRPDLFSLPRFIRELRGERYDLGVDMQGLLKSALPLRIARAERRIGPSFHREGSRFFYSQIAGPRRRDRHAVEQNLDVVRYLNLEAGRPEFPVRFPDRKLAQPHPRVAVIPCSRWRTKNWPEQCFADVAGQLQNLKEASVFFVGDSADRAVCERIGRSLRGTTVNLAGKHSMVETGSILQEMDLVISNDSGPLHMAAALGVPTVTVYGATDPDRTGPYGNRHEVLTASVDCRPCFSRQCRHGNISCLHGVTPERVTDAALRLLEERAER